ncbi:MAG: TolB family protein, partial [Bacteroidota bacterium]
VSQIYLTDLLGKRVRPVTNMPEGACQPSWSPDGTQLVFVSPCSGPNLIGQNPARDTGLYLINADGTGLTALTKVPGGDFEPAWSPDGRHIAFTSFRDGNMQVYSLNLADRTVVRLSNVGAAIEARQPEWFPSGDMIVFTARRLGAYQIWAMSSNGENARQIIRSGQTLWDYFPAPSRDGTAVLFSQEGQGAEPPAWQVSSPYEEEGTTTAVRMNLGGLPAEHAAVSPDGFWIAFQSRDKEGNTELYFVRVTGSGLTRLTTEVAQDFDPAWRPTGSE